MKQPAADRNAYLIGLGVVTTGSSRSDSANAATGQGADTGTDQAALTLLRRQRTTTGGHSNNSQPYHPSCEFFYHVHLSLPAAIQGGPRI
jgi:hypothetical protein